jgi:predicted dehydrogenase
VARTVAQAEAMIEAARAAGVKFMVAHVLRYDSDHALASQVIARGDIGQLRMAFESATGPYPEWGSHGWFADVEQSGGPVVDFGIHSLDYLMWLFNSPVTRVSAVGVQGKINLHTYALVTLRFANGGLGTVEVSWAHPRPQSVNFRTELVGTQGRITWDYEGIASLRVIHAGDETHPAGARHMVMLGENSYAAELADFVRCIEMDTAAPVTGEEGLAALRVGLAALSALETGQVVNL